MDALLLNLLQVLHKRHREYFYRNLNIFSACCTRTHECDATQVR